LLSARIKWRLKNNKNAKPNIFRDLSQIKNYSENISEFVNSKYNDSSELDNDQKYILFSSLVQSAIEEHVPKKCKFDKRKPWEDTDIINVRMKLEKIKLSYFHMRTAENRKMANECAKELADLYVKKESAYYDSLSVKLMQLSGDQQHCEAWRQIDIITGRKARAKHLINANSDEERQQKWLAHFKKLLSPEVIPNKRAVTHSNVLSDIRLSYKISEFDTKELQFAVKSLCNNKDTGVDQMCNEILKLDQFHQLVLSIINNVYVTKKVP